MKLIPCCQNTDSQFTIFDAGSQLGQFTILMQGLRPVYNIDTGSQLGQFTILMQGLRPVYNIDAGSQLGQFTILIQDLS